MAETAKSDNKKVEVFEKDDLAVSLASYIADLSDKFTKEKGSFTVVLSGGTLIDNIRSLFYSLSKILAFSFHVKMRRFFPFNGAS